MIYEIGRWFFVMMCTYVNNSILTDTINYKPKYLHWLSTFSLIRLILDSFNIGFV